MRQFDDLKTESPQLHEATTLALSILGGELDRVIDLRPRIHPPPQKALDAEELGQQFECGAISSEEFFKMMRGIL